jgi:hypothetical protein
MFERELVEVVIDEAHRKGLNFAQFARRAYGDNDTAAVKWRKQRRKDNPQQVSISDAYLLAQGLDMELPDLIFRAQAQMRTKH